LETTPVEESQLDIQDRMQSEGYTPLSELENGSNNIIFMAVPTNDEEDGATNNFHLSNTMSYTSWNDHLEPFESEDIEPFESQQTTSETIEQNQPQEVEIPVQQNSVEEEDFRSLAEEALRELEEDYATTIQVADFDNSNTTTATGLVASYPDGKEEKITCQNNEFNSDKSNQPKNCNFSKIPDDESSLVKKQEDRPPVNIDTDAIQRAVCSMQEKGAQVALRFQQWQEKQVNMSIKNHSLIPAAPLSAFFKSTIKAKQATYNLSRSATIAHCLQRLQVFENKSAQKKPKELTLHVLGADRMETQTAEKIQSTFSPLVRWLAAANPPSLAPVTVKIFLIGPNVVQQKPVDLKPKKTIPNSVLESATAICHVATYHESELLKTHPPDLAIAFNAGIWGYNDWIPTLENLKGTTFVVTAYTLEEAEEDYDVLKKYGSEEIWKAESNPFCSYIERNTQTSPNNRVYRENAAWQAWRM